MNIQRVNTGNLLRFPALYDGTRPIIIAPIDDTLLSGAIGGLEKPEPKIRSIFSANPTGVLTFSGMVERYAEEFAHQKSIINLSVSTTKGQYSVKQPFGAVEDILYLNPAAVAFHINFTSKYSNEMIRDAKKVVDTAKRYQIPVVGIIYPRGENAEGNANDADLEVMKKENNEKFTDIICHCAIAGVDLGVDLIKTHYTGSIESFTKVIDAAQGVPVVIAGGPRIAENQAISNAVEAVMAGAAGTSYARNCFGRDNPAQFIDTLRSSLETVFKSKKS